MKRGEYRVDLHVHSHRSGDNFADPEECIERALERGLQALVFTEHYRYDASEPIAQLAERYRGRIAVLRGVEFSAAEGHCLVFGADTDRWETYLPAARLVSEVNRAGGAVVPSHPYRAGSGLGDLVGTLPGIAAVEGHNGNNLVALNERALAAALARKLPVTGGSDAHDPSEVGSCCTVFPRPVTAENLVELLRAGDYRALDQRRPSRGWRIP